MPETEKTEPKAEGPDRSRLVLGALVVVLGATCAALYKIIRTSPCFQHQDGEPPLVEVAKQSAKMRLVEHPVPQPVVPLVPDPAEGVTPSSPTGNGDTSLNGQAAPRSAPGPKSRRPHV